jgi:hypothetical protein
LHAGALPLLDTDVLTSPLWEPPNSQECVGGASGINSKGDLAISVLSSTVRAIHAYLYKNGAATDLSPGILNGGLAAAIAINNYDQVVGHASGIGATLFQNGQMLDLSTLNDFGNGLLLSDVIAINDRGQILCTGSSATFLLTPAATWIQPVSFTKGTLQHNGNTFTQTITVTNTGANAIPGSISIALDGLPSGATLTNATGTTQFAGPVGSPYVDVSTSNLAPGATTTAFTLAFSYAGSTIKYTPRVLATVAPR